jgi:hypothetical protein
MNRVKQYRCKVDICLSVRVPLFTACRTNVIIYDIYVKSPPQSDCLLHAQNKLKRPLAVCKMKHALNNTANNFIMR